MQNLESVASVISGLCWTITYIALCYRGIKDKSYGMPLAALALNFTWELTFSVIYPPRGAGIVNTVINTIWCLLDIGIVYSLVRNGHKYFAEEYNMSKPTFYFSIIVAFALSFSIMYEGATFFAPFEYFKNDTFESAKFIAMFQNAVMSILFVRMFYARKRNGHPIEGQSFYAALTKMIGTSFTVGITSVLMHPGNWHFIFITEATCMIFDIWYTVLIWRELKAQGINPWKRL